MNIVAEQLLVIEAGKSGRQYWRDLWRYRELFYFLAWRDILVRYKQTAIGVAWSVVRPMLTMAVFTVIFGRFAHLSTGVKGIPYSMVVFAGILPWQFFANALAESSGSLVTNSNMVSKVYFPRIVVPTASILASLPDFAITGVLMVIMMAFYRLPATPSLVLLPLFMLLAVAAVTGPGLLMSAMNVKYRDFRYIIPFIVQIGIYISPVAYLPSIVPHKWALAYSFNPLVGVIDGFRWALLGSHFRPATSTMLVSIAVNVLVLLIGLNYFRRTERAFADII